MFMLDDLKLKGNKEYDNGNYYKAIEYYELVLGCYCWLSFKNEEMRTEVFAKFDFSGITDKDVVVQMKSVVNEEDREIETDTSNFDFSNHL